MPSLIERKYGLMGDSVSCYRHYFLISDRKLPPIWRKFSQGIRSPFSSPRYATTMTFMGRGCEWERRMVRGAHTTWKRFVKRAIDKSFGGKRAALPLFLPFLFSARCLPYGRFDLYIGVDYN